MSLINLKSEFSLKSWRSTQKKEALKDSPTPEVNKFKPTELADRVTPEIQPYDPATLNRPTPDIMRYDGGEKFKGETTPTPYSQEPKIDESQVEIVRVSKQERFKGQTTPTPYDSPEKFKGETDAQLYDQTEKFKGEVDSQLYDQTEKFKGESDAQLYDNTEKFKGETDSQLYDNTEKFKGETDATLYDQTEKFKGEQQNPLYDNTTIYNSPTDTVIIQSNPTGRHETSPTTISEVNNIPDIHAIGFTSNFGPGDRSNFQGIDPTETVYLSTSQLARPNPGEDYEAKVVATPFERFGLVKGHLDKDSTGKTFLERQYSKHNPRDDSFQLQGTAFDQPYILRGTANKNKLTPQRWGGIGIFGGDSLIRGGALGSTERAAADVIRLTKFYGSVRGLTSILIQQGLQLMNPVVQTRNPAVAKGMPPGSTRIFNPLNRIANFATQHLGLRWKRHGLLPVDEGEKYGDVLSGKILDESLSGRPGKNNRLARMRQEAFKIDIPVNSPYPSRVTIGGPDSFLGLGFTNVTRVVDSREGPKKQFLDQQFNNPVIGGVAGAISSALPINYTTIVGLLSTIGYIKIEPDYSYDKPYVGKKDGDDTKTKEQIDSDEKSLNSLFDKANKKGELNRENSKLDIQISDFRENKFNIEKQYASAESPSFLQDDFAPTKNQDDLKYVGKGIDEDNSRENQKNGAYRQNTDENGKNKPLTTDISQYAAIAYGNLPATKRGQSVPEDYRLNVERADVKKLAENTDYTTNNRATKFGLQSSAGPGADRSDYKSSLFADPITSYDYQKGVNLSDKPVNLDAFYVSDQGPGVRDFVKFFFSGPNELGKGKTDIIMFRATINGVSTTYNPSWNDVSILGRADSAKIYGGFSSNVTFNFTVYASSRSELKPMWRKLNYLASYTAPIYDNGLPRGPFMRLTLGDLYHETPGYLSSLTYTVDDAAGWEIDLEESNLENENGVGELPKKIDVSCTFELLYDFRPQRGGRFFSLSARGSNKGQYVNNQWLPDNSISDSQAEQAAAAKKAQESKQQQADAATAGAEVAAKLGGFPV